MVLCLAAVAGKPKTGQLHFKNTKTLVCVLLYVANLFTLLNNTLVCFGI